MFASKIDIDEGDPKQPTNEFRPEVFATIAQNPPTSGQQPVIVCAIRPRHRGTTAAEEARVPHRRRLHHAHLLVDGGLLRSSTRTRRVREAGAEQTSLHRSLLVVAQRQDLVRTCSPAQAARRVRVARAAR